jgi:putative acetyltransferase
MRRVYLDSQRPKRRELHMDVTILDATADDLGQIRKLFMEYAAWLGEDLCFQGFEGELARFPGDYVAPRGALFIAKSNGEAAGCVALRPLDATTGEVKRLYVRPAYRGTGLGVRLAQQVLDTARSAGYERLVLDTLQKMDSAQRLYRRLGFEPIPAYYYNPIPGALYFGLRLDSRMR